MSRIEDNKTSWTNSPLLLYSIFLLKIKWGSLREPRHPCHSSCLALGWSIWVGDNVSDVIHLEYRPCVEKSSSVSLMVNSWDEEGGTLKVFMYSVLYPHSTQYSTVYTYTDITGKDKWCLGEQEFCPNWINFADLTCWPRRGSLCPSSQPLCHRLQLLCFSSSRCCCCCRPSWTTGSLSTGWTGVAS